MLRAVLTAMIVAVLTITFGVSASATPRLKLVAFTFDDGPRPEFLSKALPYFAKEKIPATFFVVGGHAKKYPEWVRREFREGHEIENHTMNHVCLVRPSPAWNACNDLSLDGAIKEVKSTLDVIWQLTGYRTRFLRPPHFAMTAERKHQLEAALGIRVLMHGPNSIGSLDWVYRDYSRVIFQVESIVQSRGDGAYVIVFHENDVTLQALPEIVAYLRSHGYSFVRLDGLVQRAPWAKI